MIENITFKDCKISSVIFQNNTPINVLNNGSKIDSLNMDSLGDNSTKNYVSLAGDFSTSTITLISNCSINCEQDFISTNPIIISATSPISVILSGNFLGCSGLIINGPCSVTSTLNTVFQNFNISVSVQGDIQTKDVSISGNFSECNLNVNSSCNLNLGGSIGNLSIDSGIANQALSLEVDTTISSATISSLTSLSGDQSSIANFEKNIISGINNLFISSISQVVLTNEFGVSNTNLNISSSGQYKITASISLPTEDIQIGNALIITIP